MKSLLHLLGVVAIVVVPISAGATVYISYLRQEDTCDNRHAIIESFNIYTDVLVAASDDQERTDQEQTNRDQQIAEFRAEISKKLAPLLEGC